MWYKKIKQGKGNGGKWKDGSGQIVVLNKMIKGLILISDQKPKGQRELISSGREFFLGLELFLTCLYWHLWEVCVEGQREGQMSRN